MNAADENEIRRALEEELASETDQTLPTGRCRITVGDIKNCTDSMTRRACYEVAAKVGGVADWKEGARCP